MILTEVGRRKGSKGVDVTWHLKVTIHEPGVPVAVYVYGYRTKAEARRAQERVVALGGLPEGEKP